MALRRIFGFDHIPNVSSSNATMFPKLKGDLPFRVQGGVGNTKYAVFGGPSSPYLTCDLTTSDSSLCWVLDITKLIVGTPKRSWLGVRYKNFQMGSAPQSYRALLLANYAWAADSSNFHPTFMFSDLGANSAAVNGNEFYLEIEFDWVNKTIKRWVDGIELPATTVTPASVADLLATRNIGIFFVPGAGVNNRGGFKDIYWVDDTEDSTICRRLGPQTVVPVVLSAQAGSGWTGTGGVSENTVLNTVINTSTPDTPVLTSNGVATPIVVDVELPPGSYGNINAVDVSMAATKVSGSSAALGITFTDGVNTTPSKDIIPPAALTHSLKGQIFEKAADGNNWTAAKLNQSVMHLTPKA